MTAKAILELDAELRTDQGKGASRRLRRMQDKIPAILYGGGESPLTLTFDHKKVMHALAHEDFYSQILTLNVDGKKQTAVIKAVQRHHFKKAIFHLDFMRVKATDSITMHIPLHYLNEASCPGVIAGGIVSHHLIDVEIRCQAKSMPKFIEIDLSKLELDQTIHLSQIKLPKSAEFVSLSHGHADDKAVVSVHMPKRPIEVEEVVVEETPETEVIAKGKEKEGATGATSAEKAAPAPSEDAHDKDSKDKGHKGK